MKKRLVHAATLLPLAIGLANMVGPRGRALRPREVTTTTVAESALKLTCTLPFDTIKQFHPIDDSCDAGGSATDESQMAQNTAKNNFCPNGQAPGPPTSLAFADFVQLQTAAERAGVTYGSASQVPQDRSRLRNLLAIAGGGSVGEGSVVRLAAYVMDAHYSNVAKGESVNCKTPGQEDNDIHIVLQENSTDDDACNSVTAEMSPHFRPDIWMPDTLNKIAASHEFRFTGQLFFDASHRPCAGGSRPNPPRASLFEIHPVYAVDVCRQKSPQACDVNKDTDWMSLEEWVGSGASDEGSAGGSE